MLDYCLDISEYSFMRIYTADRTENPFSFCLSESGYFEAGIEYYTLRDKKPVALYLYTVSGKGNIRWKNQSALLSAGSAVLISCEEEHCYQTVSAEPWCFYWAHFTGNGLQGIKPMLMDKLTPVQVDQPMKIRDIFGQIDALHNRTDRFVFAYRSNLIDQLLIYSIRAIEREEGNCAVSHNEILPAKDYIRNHLADPISVEDLARQCNLSKYHFIRIFHRHTGFSPYRYVQITRIDKAKERLIFTDLPISEIAASVGFSSSANFSKVFREITGTSPAAYRREQYRWSE